MQASSVMSDSPVSPASYHWATRAALPPSWVKYPTPSRISTPTLRGGAATDCPVAPSAVIILWCIHPTPHACPDSFVLVRHITKHWKNFRYRIFLLLWQNDNVKIKNTPPTPHQWQGPRNKPLQWAPRLARGQLPGRDVCGGRSEPRGDGPRSTRAPALGFQWVPGLLATGLSD